MTSISSKCVKKKGQNTAREKGKKRGRKGEKLPGQNPFLLNGINPTRAIRRKTELRGE